MKYFVAADGWRRTEPKGLRVGRRVARAGSRVPSGESHAVPVDGDETLCGLDVEDLARFDDTDFELASFLRKCRTCQADASDSTS